MLCSLLPITDYLDMSKSTNVDIFRKIPPTTNKNLETKIKTSTRSTAALTATPNANFSGRPVRTYELHIAPSMDCQTDRMSRAIILFVLPSSTCASHVANIARFISHFTMLHNLRYETHPLVLTEQRFSAYRATDSESEFTSREIT